MDIYSGTVFDVGRADTRGLSLERYMQSMGAGQQPEGVEFDPVEGEKGLMQTDTDEYQSYISSLEAANNFGMQMAAKGIDVFNPRGEEGIKASRTFNQLMGRAKQYGTALRTGFEMAKMYQEQRLKEGVFGPGLKPGEPVTPDKLNELVNTNPFAKQLNDSVQEINEMAKSYNTMAERDDANARINAKVQEMGKFKKALEDTGVPSQYAEFLIENAKNAINRATYDPMEEKEFGLKASRVGSQNRVDAARAQKLLRDDDGGGGASEESLILRKRQIARIQNNDPRMLNSLIGSTVGGSKVTNVEIKEGKLRLMRSDGEIITEVGLTKENGGGFYAINTILNMVQGQKDFSTEALSKVPGPDLDEIKQEIQSYRQGGNQVPTFDKSAYTLEGFGEVPLGTLIAKYGREGVQKLIDAGKLK